MKSRQGFVSNSSSSSYILVFPKFKNYLNIIAEYIRCSANDYEQPKFKNNKQLQQYIKNYFKKIYLEMTEKNDNIYIEGFTSMHNSYHDMPHDIAALYFELIENDINVKFKREEI